MLPRVARGWRARQFQLATRGADAQIHSEVKSWHGKRTAADHGIQNHRRGSAPAAAPQDESLETFGAAARRAATERVPHALSAEWREPAVLLLAELGASERA